VILAALLLAAAVDGTADVEPFVEKNTTILAVERGDLNRDSREDAVLVLDPEDPDQPRPLLLLLRGTDGTLKLAKRSDKAVGCRQCGGIMGDPFQSVTIGKGRFTIEHYGGSSWRWSSSTTFAWSRRYQSWQLVRVEKASFHASDPSSEEKSVHTPPRDFGLIDLSEFDPENYLGNGKK
jgi:hypothetical protein